MSSWSSSREAGYRDSSPAASTPLTPLSPSMLPQWIRSKRPRAGMLSNGRLKVACITFAFVLLGYIATSTLSPSGEVVFDLEVDVYDPDSNGVMIDPYKLDAVGGKSKGDGVIAENAGVPDWQDDRPEAEKKPSVSGALFELHHAISDKIQAWNPYRGSNRQPSNSKSDFAVLAKSNKINKTLVSPDGEEVKEGIKEEDRLGARTRIGKCTILFNGNSYWERAIRTHEEHDKIHGYRLHVLRQKLMDDVWDKPAYILSLLLRELSKPESERLEWLFWVDADTVILNPYIPIETFLPPPGEDFDDVNMIYSADWNGLNNGIFPIRVTRWSVDLLSAVVSYRYYRPDDPLLFRDQTAMWTLMQEPKFARNIVNAPQRWFNAYQGEHNETLAPFQIRRGDLLVHFAGVPEREKRMGYWLDRAEQHLDDWEVPLKSTSYPAEARDFWEEQKQIRANRRSELAEKRTKAKDLIKQTDEKLDYYGDRLSDEQRDAIKDARDALDGLLGNDKWQEDIKRLDDAHEKLQQESAPLDSVKDDSNKALLNAAHEAIFAGEKALLDGGFESGKESPELSRLHDTVKALKNLVMTPQEHWNKNDITDATNAVTEARGALQSKMDKEAAEKKAKQDKAKMMDDVVKQIQAEAMANGAESKAAQNSDVAGAEDAGVQETGGRVSAEVSVTASSEAAGTMPAEAVGTPSAEAVGAASSGAASKVSDEAVATVTGHIVTITPEPVMMIYTTATISHTPSGAFIPS